MFLNIDWNWKVLIQIFGGCQDVFYFLNAWLKQSKSGKLCVHRQVWKIGMY